MITKPAHEIAFQELITLCKRMADEHGLTSLEMLAVAANMIGKLLALQDQRHVSSERAMAIVIQNMKLGNQQAVKAAVDMKPDGNC